MKDKISEQRISLLHPAIRDEVLFLMDEAEARLPANCCIRVVQGLRTFAEQARLYAIGRTDLGRRVTNAKAGSSYHNYGLALDFCLLYDLDNNGSYEKLSWDVNDEWRSVAEMFEDNGYKWGGNFSRFVDAPHIERSFDFHWRELLRRYNEKDFLPGTEYVNLNR